MTNSLLLLPTTTTTLLERSDWIMFYYETNIEAHKSTLWHESEHFRAAM
jgi:hypothetical protein